MLKKKIAFIGAGNMAQALIRALILDGFNPKNIFVSNPSPDKLEKLQKETLVHTEKNNVTAAKEVDIIILCVKPQQLNLVCLELKNLVCQKKPLIISVAAGAPTHFFSTIFQDKISVIRTMPNLPSLVGAGATALCHNEFTSHDQQEMAEIIFRSVGIIAWVEESQIDAINALSGCGPAYVFLIMEILQKIAEDFGISKENSKLFTLQTVFGSAKLALESEETFSNLRHSVASPKGTTAAALSILEEGHLDQLFEKALKAAKNRAKELSDIVTQTQKAP